MRNMSIKSWFYKYISFFCAIIILFGVFSATAFAEMGSDEKPRRLVKVGYCKNYGIIHQNSDMGEYYGYGYDYLMKIAQYTNWEYEFIEVEWEPGLVMLKNGELDLFGPMQYSAARDQLYSYPKEAAGVEYGVLYALKDNDDIFYDDFYNFNNMRVATMLNNFHTIAFEDKYCKKNNFKVNYYFCNGISQLVEMLEKNEADVFIAGSLMASDDTKIVGKYSADPFYFATYDGNTHLIDEFNSALDSLRVDDTYFTARLHDKYYKNSIYAKSAYTKSENDFIDTTKPIRLVYADDWVPMEYYNPETNSFEGINADIMRLIEESSGLNFEFMRAENLKEALDFIFSGRADGLVGGLMRSEDRRKYKLVQTDSYIDVPFVLITQNNSAIVEKPTIGISKLNAEMLPEVSKIYPESEIIIFESTDECLQALQEGTINASLLSSYAYSDYVYSGKYGHLAILSVTQITMPMKISVADYTSPDLLTILNKSISRLDYSQINAIITKNTIKEPDNVSLSSFINKYSGHIVFIIIAASMSLIVIIDATKRSNYEKLSKIAYYDSLTGLINLDKFKIDAPRLIDKADGNSYAIVYADINKFKYINDFMGYSVGNQVLLSTAETLLEGINPETELVARAFADNFVILLKRKNNKEVMQRFRDINRKLVDKISKQYNYVQIFFNVGIYVVTDDDKGNDINPLIDNANLARKSAKDGHKNTFAFYDEKLHNNVVSQAEIENSMHAALARSEFIMYLQPKYDLHTEKIVGAEALVRWNHPIRGLIQPSEFIPIFERNGFIVNLDMFVLEEACRTINEWKESGIEPVPISVNLSRIHLGNDKLAESIHYIVKNNGVEPKYIEIEITESIVYNNVEVLLKTLEHLQRLGYLISMDDFGTGYSSLNLLKDIPINILKLDKEFLNSADNNERGQKVISNIVLMAQNLNILVVAEGVETKEQADFLRGINCDIAQGYYYAQPMTTENFKELVSNEAQTI